MTERLPPPGVSLGAATDLTHHLAPGLAQDPAGRAAAVAWLVGAAEGGDLRAALSLLGVVSPEAKEALGRWRRAEGELRVVALVAALRGGEPVEAELRAAGGHVGGVLATVARDALATYGDADAQRAGLRDADPYARQRAFENVLTAAGVSEGERRPPAPLGTLWLCLACRAPEVWGAAATEADRVGQALRAGEALGSLGLAPTAGSGEPFDSVREGISTFDPWALDRLGELTPDERAWLDALALVEASRGEHFAALALAQLRPAGALAALRAGLGALDPGYREAVEAFEAAVGALEAG
jgi:hypothetical protein